MSLLQRVDRLEEEVGIGEGSKKQDSSKDSVNSGEKGDNQQEKKPEPGDNKKEQANESTDPFNDVFEEDCISNKRRGLVKEVCESGSHLDELVDDCIFGDID
jgi:hypothetical protein